MYHYYTCPELGPDKAALRRFPCNCQACDEVISRPWIPGVDPQEQARFEDADDCFFKPLLEDENKWHLVQLKEKSSTDKEDVDEERQVVLRHVTTAVGRSIEVGKIGAYAFELHPDHITEDEYYLVEFIGLPYTEQDENSDDEQDENKDAVWKVDCYWLIEVPGARFWYTRSTQKITVHMVHVVSTDVELIPISPTNMIRNRAVRKAAAEKNAVKIAEKSHDFILDEIRRRERLEYDPSRVFVGDDLDSDDEEEIQNF